MFTRTYMVFSLSAVRHSRARGDPTADADGSARWQPVAGDSTSAGSSAAQARATRPAETSFRLRGRHVNAANVNPDVHDMAGHRLSLLPRASYEADCARRVQLNTVARGEQDLRTRDCLPGRPAELAHASHQSRLHRQRAER